MQKATWISVFAALGSLTFGSMLLAQQAEQDDLKRRLMQRVTVVWQDQQLANVLERLSESQGLSIWLDRRVDPEQQVTARFSDLPLRQVLERSAEKHSLGISVLEGIVYVGPEQATEDLATVVQQAHDALAKVSPAARRIWLRSEPSDWPRLSEPRALLSNLLDGSGIMLVGGEQIPHDLWQARQLPPMPLVERVVLLLAGFDLTCQIAPDGRSCEVVPIQRPVAVSRHYELPRNRQRILKKLQQMLPTSEFELKGQKLAVLGKWEDHLQVQDILAGRSTNVRESSRSRPEHSQQQFTLRLKNQPVGQVIEQLGRQLELQIVWDEESLAKAERSRETLVSCNVKDASLDQLLQSVLAPAGMRHQREGKKVSIEATQ